MRFERLKSRRAFYALSLLLLISSPGLYAQVKTGVVRGFVSSSKNEPISGASVVIKNVTNNFTLGTSTDNQGVFTFAKIPSGGPYSFTFSAIGFEKQTLSGYTIKDDATVSLMIKLKDSAETIDQVVVIGSGAKKKTDVTSPAPTERPHEIA